MVTETANPRQPVLSQESGDIVLDEMGHVIGLGAIPDQEREVLVVDWQDGVAGFYLLDLHSRTIADMGGIELLGPRPRLDSYVWPWVLLQTENDRGSHSWALIDLSSGQAQIAWSYSAGVPQGLRRRPVWFNGSSWYLGPVTGPRITDILTGRRVGGHDFEPVNPVSHPWPRWGGPVTGSHWYMVPVSGGGSALINLETNSQLLLAQDQDIAWNTGNSRMAWRQDNQLGLLSTEGQIDPLDLGDVIPGPPLWSSNGENLYFLGGEQDFFGTTWRDLWVYDEQDPEGPEEGYYWETGARPIVTLPGNWTRWRLLAATDEAVLAAAGENSELLFYFDLMTQKTHEIKGTEAGNWVWQGGTLIAVRAGEIIRISPGFGIRNVSREAKGYSILGIVNQFVFYTHDGRVFIKQIVMN
jgi:hypothetical protein